MLAVTFDESRSVVILEPDGPLSLQDFEGARHIIDEHLALRGDLRGIIIWTEAFPGWESFKSVLGHLKFIRDHHKWVRNVALVTDSTVLDLAEHPARHFIKADIRRFSFNELESARVWIMNNTDCQ